MPLPQPAPRTRYDIHIVHRTMYMYKYIPVCLYVTVRITYYVPCSSTLYIVPACSTYSYIILRVVRVHSTRTVLHPCTSYYVDRTSTMYHVRVALLCTYVCTRTRMYFISLVENRSREGENGGASPATTYKYKVCTICMYIVRVHSTIMYTMYVPVVGFCIATVPFSRLQVCVRV